MTVNKYHRNKFRLFVLFVNSKQMIPVGRFLPIDTTIWCLSSWYVNFQNILRKENKSMLKDIQRLTHKFRWEKYLAHIYHSSTYYYFYFICNTASKVKIYRFFLFLLSYSLHFIYDLSFYHTFFM